MLGGFKEEKCKLKSNNLVSHSHNGARQSIVKIVTSPTTRLLVVE